MPTPIEVKWANHGEENARLLVSLYERAQSEIRETIAEYDEKGQGNLRATHYRDIDKQVTETLAILRQQSGAVIRAGITGIMGGASGDAATEANNLDASFNINLGLSRINPKLVNYHVFRGLSKLKNVNDVVEGRIREQLAFGQLKGMHAIAVAKMIGGQPPQRDNALIRTAGTGLTLEGIAPVFPSVMHRAYTIARTENGDAANASFHDTLSSLDIDDGLPVGKEWNNEVDKRTSEICLSLGHAFGNNAILVTEAFLCPFNGKLYMHPTAHPNCRCRVEVGKLKGAALERWRQEKRMRATGTTTPVTDPFTPPVAPPTPPKPVVVAPVKPPVVKAPPKPVEPPKAVTPTPAASSAYPIDEYRKEADRIRALMPTVEPKHAYTYVEALGRTIDSDVRRAVGNLETAFPEYAKIDKERNKLQKELIGLMEEKVTVPAVPADDWLSELLGNQDPAQAKRRYEVAKRIADIDIETNVLKEKHAKKVFDETLKVMREIRPFGGEAIKYKTTAHETNKAVKLFQQAASQITDYMPREWIETSNANPLSFGTEKSGHKIKGAAWYNHGIQTVAVRVKYVNGADDEPLEATLAHEMSHRFEYVVPGIKKAEGSLMRERTKGELNNGWVPPMAGYGQGIIGFKDKFPTPYMGRIYGGHSDPYGETKAYEMLSVLQERLIKRKAFEDDLQLRAWHIGVLVAL